MSTPKSLPERISERLAARQLIARSRSRTRAIVFELRADIAAARASGFSIKQAWETLVSEGVIGVSYDAFRRLANELVFSKAQHRRRTRADKKPELGATRSFAFSATPNPKDLV